MMTDERKTDYLRNVARIAFESAIDGGALNVSNHVLGLLSTQACLTPDNPDEIAGTIRMYWQAVDVYRHFSRSIRGVVKCVEKEAEFEARWQNFQASKMLNALEDDLYTELGKF